MSARFSEGRTKVLHYEVLHYEVLSCEEVSQSNTDRCE